VSSSTKPFSTGFIIAYPLFEGIDILLLTVCESFEDEQDLGNLINMPTFWGSLPVASSLALGAAQ
jgi:hypothetical protein